MRRAAAHRSELPSSAAAPVGQSRRFARGRRDAIVGGEKDYSDHAPALQAER